MSDLDQLANALSAHGDVRRDELMSRHTTFGVGGPADIYLTVRDADALAASVNICHAEGVSRFILGSGSNIVVADGGIRGVVIDNRARAEETDDGFTYRVESGASFAAFARRMCRAGRDGLTWAVGIPGTLGGAVVYNAGAYGGCLADVLTRVHLHEDGGASAWIDAEPLGLVYRGSVFTRGQFAGKTVLGVEVRLVEGDPAALLAIAAAHDEKRLAAQPRGRNAGSMFKNPTEKPAWKLIDEVGMRGARRGDAAVSDLHSNFFVNYGTARASDVAALVEEAERRVAEQFGITLEREVAFVGGVVMVMRVAVVMGGRSGEHEVSLRSAASVIAALDRDRWEPVAFGVTRAGHWLTTAETAGALASGATAFESGGLPLLNASDALAGLASCDVVFPLIHGTFGEDGCIQGFLEMADLPYAGPGVAASAIGMDKALMKMAFRDAGVPVAREVVVQSIDLQAGEDEIAGAVAASVGYPCFVKPANGGSSVGVTKVRSREDLGDALAAAFAYGEKALIEAAISGSEVECSVLGNERPEASITGEIAPDREFYDYDSKYDSTSSTELHIPARVSESAAERVRELALRAYRAVGAEGYSRVDFFVEGETVTANEINTIPGFTSISMYPKLWEASGLGYQELLSRILDLALERHGRRAAR